MELKPGYKQTEVGAIPEDWEAVQLHAACSMKSGEAITAARITEHGQYPCYGGNGLRGYTTRYTHDGDYALVGRQGALCGNVVRAKGKFYASEHAVVVTGLPGTDIRFLTYVLREMRLNRFSESSAQPGLSVAKILRLPVALPPTESEQRAIAEALSDVDALLDGLDRLIAKKRDLKQAAMQQLLTGRQRLPGFSGEWEVRRLGEVADLRRENVVPAVNPNQLFVHFSLPAFDSGQMPVVEIGAGIASNKFRVPPTAILVSKLNPRIPRVWAPAEFPEQSIASTEFLVLVPRPTVSRSFLHAACLSPMFCDQMELAVTGTTGSHQRINPMDALAITIAMPNDVNEQTAIAAVLSDMDAEIAALEVRRDKTRALKQAMMQELLTGRIRLV